MKHTREKEKNKHLTHFILKILIKPTTSHTNVVFFSQLHTPKKKKGEKISYSA